MANSITSKELLDTYNDADVDFLIEKREKLMDFFTHNGRNHDELMHLLEIERELTLREGA